MRNVLGGLAVIITLAGCGDDHKDSAQDKCETLVDTFCDNVTTCAVDADLLDVDYSPKELMADCRETVGKSAHCGDAKEVTRKYDDCLAAAGELLQCDDSNDALLYEDTFAIPAECKGVVRY